MSDSELIWNASLSELKAGYVETGEHYTCLCCGTQFEKGIIYPDGDRLYEAERYTRLHVEREHQSVFAYLTGLDKRVTGLSEVQKRLLGLFYLGKSDAEIQRELGVGSTSTVRNHRFLLKEKERQARVFLAIMELLRERQKGAPAPVEPLPSQWAGTVSERDQVIQKYFPYGVEGPLQSFSMKAKHRRIVLSEIARRFELGRTYTEKEVNAVLEPIYADHVMLRRYLVDYGFMERLPDGSQYWLVEPAEGVGKRTMDRREAKRLAKEATPDAGVYQIRNSRNGKIFVGSSRNLKSLAGQRFQLESGTYRNQQLQQEWNEFGPEAFAFEVLEVLQREETPFFDVNDALKKLEAKWLERLQPYGERGYHTPRRAE